MAASVKAAIPTPRNFMLIFIPFGSGAEKCHPAEDKHMPCQLAKLLADGKHASGVGPAVRFTDGGGVSQPVR